MYGYACMDIMYGCVCMAMYVWLHMYGYICMALYVCMDVCMYVCKNGANLAPLHFMPTLDF